MKTNKEDIWGKISKLVIKLRQNNIQVSYLRDTYYNKTNIIQISDKKIEQFKMGQAIFKYLIKEGTNYNTIWRVIDKSNQKEKWIKELLLGITKIRHFIM